MKAVTNFLTVCLPISRNHCITVLPQVCVRSSGPVRVALGGSVLEQSVPSSFNAVLLCQDVQLDHGRVPISIQWASAPNSVQTLLQLWVVSIFSGAQHVQKTRCPVSCHQPRIGALAEHGPGFSQASLCGMRTSLRCPALSIVRIKGFALHCALMLFIRPCK